MDNIDHPIFDKQACDLLNGILQGRNSGVEISGRIAKISAELAKNGISITNLAISQKLFWKNNDQPFWRAVYAVAKAERPKETRETFAALTTKRAKKQRAEHI